MIQKLSLGRTSLQDTGLPGLGPWPARKVLRKDGRNVYDSGLNACGTGRPGLGNHSIHRKKGRKRCGAKQACAVVVNIV